MTDDHTIQTIAPACPRPCSSCPWRLANQNSKPDPHKFFTSANLKRLWGGLRKGARMTCHPTDPRMASFAGYEALADREVTHECTGGLTLQQRELMAYQAIAEANPKGPTFKQYKQHHPNGLTLTGLRSIVERAMFGGTAFDSLTMARPDLGDAEIGYLAITAAKK